MPLKSFRVAANLPGEVEQLVEKRIREERYPSVSAYIVGLVLFDIYARRPHWLTGTLMREPQWVRDQAILELVRDFDKVEEKGPGWFEKKIADIIADKKKKDESSPD